MRWRLVRFLVGSGTLATIADATAAANVQSPALLVVGKAVSLQRRLAWFNSAAPLEVSQSA